MQTERFDVIIIGSGAGGGTVAQALASTAARILVIERGEAVPREDANWDPAAVWKHLRYRTTEQWRDERGAFTPYTHYCVGGNTKFWGSVLIRLRREDFGVLRHMDGESPAWPIAYEDLAPYYDAAERMYGVRGEAGIDRRQAGGVREADQRQAEAADLAIEAHELEMMHDVAAKVPIEPGDAVEMPRRRIQHLIVGDRPIHLKRLQRRVVPAEFVDRRQR